MAMEQAECNCESQLMADKSMAWMARPVAHENTIRAQVVSKLDENSKERLLRWTRDCLVTGLEVGVKEHLRLVKREDMKAAPVPESGPVGK